MSQVSRPMQILLVGTMLFAAVWFVALRPKPSNGEQAAAPAPAPAQTAPASDGGAAPGTAGLKGAIDKAHGAVATADADAQRAQQTSADGPATPAPAPAAAAPGAAATARPQSVPDAASHAARGKRGDSAGHAARHRRGGGSEVGAVKAALRHHKAIAIAFVDPSTADGRAVAQEIGHVAGFGGRALAVAVPLTKLSDYDFITNRVEVTVAPTIVIVDRSRHATTIVGFADRGEIEQRLADALAAKR